MLLGLFKSILPADGATPDLPFGLPTACVRFLVRLLAMIYDANELIEISKILLTVNYRLQSQGRERLLLLAPEIIVINEGSKEL